ncbi:MFS transporter [Tetzosporium hominis]|uniref:MFS transporter n=1 Tax=Tetzosporium hominis TaxID=2020506 RepID=A0A264W602_9BACL|nr:MFS transporter [Tetzosporium hominis]OZS79013.1 MFS transporter [Tetzosporium hominis]
MKQERLWTKNFIMISSVNFLLTLVFFLLVVIIGLYAVDEFNATTSQAGLVTGIFIVGTLIGRLFIGARIERIGRKKTLIIGFIFFNTVTLFYFFSSSIPVLLITRLLHGISLGIASTAAATIVAFIIPMARRGEGIGYFSMSSTLATAIGPFVGLLLTQVTTFQTIFAICFGVGIVGLLAGLVVQVPNLKLDVAKEPGVKQKFSVRRYLEPSAIPIAFVTLAVAFCFSSVLSFMNFYAIEQDLIKAASVFFLVYAISVLVSRPFTGRLMDLKGANYVMYPALVLLAAGLVVLGSATSSLSFLIAASLIGFGFGNIQSCTQAIAVKITPRERMGMATSTFFIFLDAGLGFGPYILGFVLGIVSFSQMYLSLGFVAFVTIGLYYAVYGRSEKDRLSI